MRARGIQFRSLREQLDTTTPSRELIFTVPVAVAQFERDINREQTRAGLAAARSRGRVGGRPRLLIPERAELAREAVAACPRQALRLIRADLATSLWFRSMPQGSRCAGPQIASLRRRRSHHGGRASVCFGLPGLLSQRPPSRARRS